MELDNPSDSFMSCWHPLVAGNPANIGVAAGGGSNHLGGAVNFDSNSTLTRCGELIVCLQLDSLTSGHITPGVFFQRLCMI